MAEKKPAAILRKLREAGYEAWYVGGCVRDTLLGREVHDWDVTTSALPEQTMACFQKTVPTGIKHGTVTVLEDGTQAEVTTYRTDGDYRDGRHPEQVTFVRSLAEDLARRDFTVNAMAMDEEGNIVDLYGGQADLHHGILRCVGDPERRFREDALRMLRAIRFSAQLGFTIESKTREAMQKLGHLCESLSAERIRDEMEKTILSDRPSHIEQIAQLGLLPEYGLYDGADCQWLSALPKDRTIRWAGLCRSYPHLDLMTLRLDKQTARDAMMAGRLDFPETTLGWKHLIAEQGRERASITAALAGKSDLIQEILNSGHCLSLKELAVTGADFPALSGREVGNCLQKLLYHVLEHPEDNEKFFLKKLIK